MPQSRSKSKRRRKRKADGRRARDSNASLARTLAPEELRPGGVVALLHEIVEIPSWHWHADAATLPPDETVRVMRMPDPPGVPLEVEAVCLPFVLVQTPCGSARTLDVRSCRLARLDGGYARTARLAIRSEMRRAARLSKK